MNIGIGPVCVGSREFLGIMGYVVTTATDSVREASYLVAQVFLVSEV